MPFKSLFIGLLTTSLVLPIAIVVLGAVARLLAAMQDDAGAIFLDRVALALGIVWLIDLICLVLAQGLAAVAAGQRRDDSEHPEQD